MKRSALGNWQSQTRCRSFSCNSFDVYVASKQVSTLAHPQKADRRLSGLFFLSDSSSVVTDRENERAGLLLYRHVNSGGLGMTEDVGQRLLENSESCGGSFLIQMHVGRSRVAMNDDPGSI